LESVGGAVLCGLGVFCCSDLVITCGSHSSLSGSYNLQVCWLCPSRCTKKRAKVWYPYILWLCGVIETFPA
jgi:hypothetical protein